MSWRLDRPVGGAPVDPVGHIVVGIPADHAALRVSDPQAAAAHRSRVGAALSDAIDAGVAVLGWADAGYVLGRDDA